jgi:hypothetical protein
MDIGFHGIIIKLLNKKACISASFFILIYMPWKPISMGLAGHLFRLEIMRILEA